MKGGRGGMMNALADTTTQSGSRGASNTDREPNHREGVADMDSSATGAQALYRFYGDDGALLYVGITANPSARFKQHGQTKSWWPEVRGISVEWYDSRRGVLAAETRAIHIENPAYNIQRPALPATSIVPGIDTEDGDEALRIEWDCSWCGGEVDDGEGHLYINEDELFESRHAAATIDAADDGSIWGSPKGYHGPAYWRVAHTFCTADPDHENSTYALEVEQVRTYPKVLWWTAHLSGKTWLSDTNWMGILRRLAEVAGEH